MLLSVSFGRDDPKDLSLDPSKLANVDQVLSMFGNGTELVKALEEKYGVRPNIVGAQPETAPGEDMDALTEVGPEESDLEANVRERISRDDGFVSPAVARILCGGITGVVFHWADNRRQQDA